MKNLTVFPLWIACIQKFFSPSFLWWSILFPSWSLSWGYYKCLNYIYKGTAIMEYIVVSSVGLLYVSALDEWNSGFLLVRSWVKTFGILTASYSQVPALFRAGSVREQHSTLGSGWVGSALGVTQGLWATHSSWGKGSATPHLPSVVLGSDSAEAQASRHPAGWRGLGCAKAKPHWPGMFLWTTFLLKLLFSLTKPALFRTCVPGALQTQDQLILSLSENYRLFESWSTKAALALSSCSCRKGKIRDAVNLLWYCKHNTQVSSM